MIVGRYLVSLRTDGEAITVDRATREIRLAAVAFPSHFSRAAFQPGHHAVVWRGGISHPGALFVTTASDQEVRRALISLDATPGENLTSEAWTRARDATSTAPDQRVEGAPVDVFVDWRGKRVALEELLVFENSPASLDLRFGGNERWRKRFRSGCIVCNASCPGGVIGNRALTLREEEGRDRRHTLRAGELPAEGEQVTVILRVAPVAGRN